MLLNVDAEQKLGSGQLIGATTAGQLLQFTFPALRGKGV